MGRWRKLALAAAGAAIVSLVAAGLALAHGGGGFGGTRISPVEILSDMTGVSVENITTARQGGDSLADIAEANGVTTDDYVAAVVEAATTAIDDAVADGKLSEDRAATIKEGLTDKVTAMVTSEAGWHGRSRGWAVKLDSKPSPVVVLSELSGLSVEEIREQRVEGTSLDDIGEANGVSKDDYVDELVDRSDGGHRRDGRGGTPERGPRPDDQGWVGGSRGVPGDRHRRAGARSRLGPRWLRPRQIGWQAWRLQLLQISIGGNHCTASGSVASPRRTVCGSRPAAGSRRRDDSRRLPVKHQRVLVVDDDPDIRRLVSAYLRREGMDVITAEDGETALMHEATQQPDIVVLDLMLPGIGGLDVLRTIRERGPRPVVLLTARDEVTDRVLGLELGADDYVTKPFHPRELVARVHTILRRARAEPAATSTRVGSLDIDSNRRQVRRDGELLPLTRTEFDLLATLAQADGRVLSRAELLDAVAGPDSITLQRSIDSHIRNLRRKVETNPGEPRYVVTVTGVGYRLGDG